MTHSSITTLNHLLASDPYYAKRGVMRFLKAEFNQRNREVLEYFFYRLASDHKCIDEYFDKDFFEMVLRSHWPEAHHKMAQQLRASPYSLPTALNVLSFNDEVFTTTVNTVMENIKATPISAKKELEILEILALAAIENNKPELYNHCYERSLEIDNFVKPFELQHGQFCTRAVENGAWWAVKSIIGDGAESYVFYKTFEDATEFAPISVLNDLYQTWPRRFVVEFAGRAAEYLCKREPTPELFELIAKIVLAHTELKMNTPAKLWPVCRNFVDNPQLSNQAWQILDHVWLTCIPYFLVSNILDNNPNEVKNNAEILRHMSEKHPESYATIFQMDSKIKSRLQPKMVDALLFGINDATDQLLVNSEYETEKLNIFRQKILLTSAVGAPHKSVSKRKI